MLLQDLSIELLPNVVGHVLTNHTERELLAEPCEERCQSKDEHQGAPLVALLPHFLYLMHFHQHKQHFCHDATNKRHKGTLNDRNEETEYHVDLGRIVAEKLLEQGLLRVIFLDLLLLGFFKLLFSLDLLHNFGLYLHYLRVFQFGVNHRSLHCLRLYLLHLLLYVFVIMQLLRLL